MSVLNYLVDADLAGAVVVRGYLDFDVAEVYEALDGLDLPVAVLDCSTWGCITMIVCAWHAVDGAFGHGGPVSKMAFSGFSDVATIQ